MAFGLSPLVKGGGVKGKALIALFVASMTGTAAAIGASLGSLGVPISSRINVLPTLGAVALVGLLLELRILPFSVPYRHWQVPRDWPVRYGSWGGYALWGATLGLGFVSYVPFASYHVFLICMLMSGGPVAGAAVGILYGVGRALASLLPAVKAASHSDEFRDRAAAALDREELQRGRQVAGLFAMTISLGLGASFGVGG